MNKETIIELSSFQDETNKRTIGQGWQEKDLDWGLEIIAELGEAIESSKHKWWKKNVLDLDNIKVEIIDMLHFSLSLDMTRMSKESLAEKASEPLTVNDSEFSQKLFSINAHRVIRSVASGEIATPAVLELASSVGMDETEIRGRYIAKNALNLLRQDSGYKEGYYMKIWNGEEDNVWVMNFIKENPDADFDEVYKQASDQYKRTTTSFV